MPSRLSQHAVPVPGLRLAIERRAALGPGIMMMPAMIQTPASTDSMIITASDPTVTGTVAAGR